MAAANEPSLHVLIGKEDVPWIARKLRNDAFEKVDEFSGFLKLERVKLEEIKRTDRVNGCNFYFVFSSILDQWISSPPSRRREITELEAILRSLEFNDAANHIVAEAVRRKSLEVQDRPEGECDQRCLTLPESESQQSMDEWIYSEYLNRMSVDLASKSQFQRPSADEDHSTWIQNNLESLSVRYWDCLNYEFLKICINEGIITREEFNEVDTGLDFASNFYNVIMRKKRNTFDNLLDMFENYKRQLQLKT